jgi:site-specific recombinase XerD
MGVAKYTARKSVFWMVDEWLTLPDGRVVRYRQRRIPTKEQAVALLAKKRAEAFEGRFFDRKREPSLTVAEVWAAYEPICKRDNDAAQTEIGRARHVLRHLGDRRATRLSLRDVDEYRTLRLGEVTQRGVPPAPATLDREVELLKRSLNYAVACGRLAANPIAHARLLRKPNVRRQVIDEVMFVRLLEASDPSFQPILVLAYDTGMRKREILDLRWSQVDLRGGIIRLAPQDTKGEESRTVYLTERALSAFRELPRAIGASTLARNDPCVLGKNGPVSAAA